MAQPAIGVFDSGLGGLTVLRALQQHLPDEQFIYLGDTARVPYGTKSEHSVTQYALQVAARLRQENIKLLVVACNTASAMALPAIQHAMPDLPVIGVIEPGAAAAIKCSKKGHIGVIATEGTVQRGAYSQAMSRLSGGARVSSKACSLFVALVEEGWISGPLVEAIVAEYLQPLRAKDPELDTLVLGCTHFPVLRPVIQNVMGAAVTLVDSAETTAVAVGDALHTLGLKADDTQTGRVRLWVTDGPERFARVAGIFFGEPVSPQEVELIDL